MRIPHEDIEVVIDGETFTADKEFVPLLLELSAVGLKTTQHCAGHDANRDGTGGRSAYLSLDMRCIQDACVRMIDGYPRLVIWWNRQSRDAGKGE